MTHTLLKTQIGLQRRFTNALAGRSRQLALWSAAGLALSSLVNPSAALADGAPPAVCNGTNVNNLVALAKRFLTFLITIGGIVVVIVYALAAMKIITGGKSNSVQGGITMLKNATLGLVVLVLCFVIRNVVLDVVGGATTGSASDQAKCNAGFQDSSSGVGG